MLPTPSGKTVNDPIFSIERDVVRMALNATRLLKATANNLSEKSGHLKHHHAECVLVIGGEPWRYSEGSPVPR